MNKSFFSFLVIILLGFQSANFLNAQIQTTDTAQVHERIQYIQQMLNDSKTAVNLWWYGWLGAYSTATIGQGAVYFISEDKATKQDMALGAATTFLGAAFQIITPLNTGKDAAKLSKLPENTIEEQLRKLEIAEELLKSNAMKEKAGRSWQIHALNSAVNLGSGLIIWLGYKRSVWDGVGNFLLNSVITETQIWTQPTRTQKDYNNYFRKYKSGKSPYAYQVKPEYFVRTFPGGASLTIVF